MTKEEYVVAIKDAETTLNNLIKDARLANNIVNLTVITKEPISTVSLVSVQII
jgi:hypothetical protein